MSMNKPLLIDCIAKKGDISKGELRDIVFMGEVGDMQGNAVLLAGDITMGTTEIDGKSYETASFYTLSTSSDTDP